MTTIHSLSGQTGERIGTGRTADVYSYGEDFVLKLYKDFISAVVVEREFNVTRAAFEAGLPVPETLKMVKQGGCYGIVFERISGISLMQALQQKPWRIREIAGQLAELHVKINACPVPVNLPSQREQIKYSLDHVDIFNPEKKAGILNALSALPDGNHLCHGDFHPENVLLSDHGPIIIDWMTGSYGNPAADLARSVLILETSALPPHIAPLNRLVINLFRKLLIKSYRDHYLLLSPLPVEELFAWQLPLLSARLFEVQSYPKEKAAILKRIDSLLNLGVNKKV